MIRDFEGNFSTILFKYSVAVRF